MATGIRTRWYFVSVRYRMLGVAALSFLLFLHPSSNLFLSCAYFSLGPFYPILQRVRPLWFIASM